MLRRTGPRDGVNGRGYHHIRVIAGVEVQSRRVVGVSILKHFVFVEITWNTNRESTMEVGGLNEWISMVNHKSDVYIGVAILLKIIIKI